jgi:hypothetical protein
MILSIPYQALEIGNIHLTPFQSDKYGKSIARLSYKDNSINFNDVTILSPPLKIIDYNQDNSRLRLDLSEQFHFQTKIFTLQEYLVSTFYIHQQSFLNQYNNSQEQIHSLFNFLLYDNILSIYVFPTFTVKKQDDSFCKVSDLKPGDTIRCAIRIQGVSINQLKHNIRFRLQHSISSIWFVPNEK